MSQNKSATTALAKLFDAGPDPIYVLDDCGTIVYCNRALAGWAGLAKEQIIGRRLGYHPPSPEEADASHTSQTAGLLAGLAPPPEAFEGQKAEGHISTMTDEGRLRYRQTTFLPIGAGSETYDGPEQCVGVIAMVGASDLSSAQLAESTSQAGQLTDALHLAIRQFRAEQSERYDLDHFVGQSASIMRTRRQIALAAASDASVIFYGPVGSGRSHAAQAVYYRSLERLHGDLTSIDCSILSEGQLRSAVELANSQTRTGEVGTLLLLEVDQLSSAAQSYLVERLADPSFALRVLSTALCNLEEMAGQGGFETDLACQLATLAIALPPLAERTEDLPLLAQLFVEQANQRSSRQIGGLSSEAIEMLSLYDWPGQVAELAEAVATAHYDCSGSTISVGDLPAKLRQAADSLAYPAIEEERIVLDQFLAKIERELVCRALDQAGGNKASAARLLGMTRPRLYRRLAQLGLIDKPTDEGPAIQKSKTGDELSDSETPDFEMIDEPIKEPMEETDEFDSETDS